MKVIPQHILSAIVLLVGILVFIITLASTTSARTTFSEKPLSSDDLAQVSEAALLYTESHMTVVGSAPQVAHVQLISGSELPTLGLQEIKSYHALALVIVKGDIDVSGAWPGSSQGVTRYKYINYVFDLKVGSPTLIWAEQNADVYKRALNPAERLKEPLEPPGLVPLGTPMPDGSVAPTVVPPTSDPSEPQLP